MKWDPNNPKVPFNEKGDMLPWTWRGENLKAVRPFVAMLRLKSIMRGRSSVQVTWQSSEGKQFPMFLRDFQELLLNHTLDRGTTPPLEWKFVKRGQNYGIAVQGELGD